jgi:tyrosyl-tRNA synthetase
MARFLSTPSPDEQLEPLMADTDYGDAELAASMRRELSDRLRLGRPLTVYLGVDPTSPNIHIGHCVVLDRLRMFQDFGHRVIFVIGDATAQVGDPTGRSRTRPPLTAQEVAVNAATFADQAFRVLDRSRTELVYNSTWLLPLSLVDVIRLTSQFTVAQLLAREDFGKRFAEDAPIHLHEFLYALMQGEDAAHLKTDVQLGGRDQLFNILTGRDVMRHRGLAPQIALILPILPGTDGKLKMSKSYGNDIGVSAAPEDMYGKIMSLPDDVMPDYFRLTSGLPHDEVDARLASLKSAALHPRDAKMELARLVVARRHDAASATRAEAAFVAQFQKHEAPENVPELSVPAGASVLDVILLTGLAKSRSEAKRLVEQGAANVDDVKLESWAARLAFGDGALLRVGRRGLFRLKREG